MTTAKEEQAAQPPVYRTASHVHVGHLSLEQFDALKSAEKKVFRRVLLLCIALMMVNYLDRTNLAFASVQLNKDIQLDHATYGLGAGLFFAAYASLQVPSNILMTRIGGPVWLGIIGTGWGTVAACFSLVNSVPTFLALRVLLGMFEAGALPGMWALLAHFYSKQRLTMPLGWLMGALIVSQALGAPIAAGLMALNGKGDLRGWQWLFLIEGLLAVVVSLGFFWMPRDIDAMRGLAPAERDALHASMAHHAKPATDVKKALLAASANPAVWAAGLGVKFMRDIGFYGLIYFLPLIIESMLPANTPNKSTWAILLTAVPFVCSAAAQFASSWHSQRRNERRFHLAAFWSFGALCLALLPLPQMRGAAAGAFVLLVLGVVGVFGVEGVSISYYMALMGGEKGIGIAVINMLGALGGFVGPYVVGGFSGATGSYYSSLWFMAGCLAVAAAVAAIMSEQWAAQFSLKPSGRSMTGSRRQSQASFSVPIDAAMFAGMGALADSICSSDDEDAQRDTAAAAPDGDVEAGGQQTGAAAKAGAAGAAATATKSSAT